ncbi:hypothetical protein [Endomicrobium proavitum]|uniref:Uncharacterized protein n=1 Tax=Endomicrobium proavitum TaxID=1408281 RepID=A0A0G3WL55_9BACT|nr:hypothetical protein [Endomicrobium proavitum]AKL98615.1 hypothetical protein Epro_1236 [Endomicrobium proavitum]
MNYGIKNAIKIFEDKKIRSVWNETEEEWYFLVVYVIAVLTERVRDEIYYKYQNGKYFFNISVCDFGSYSYTYNLARSPIVVEIDKNSKHLSARL